MINHVPPSASFSTWQQAYFTAAQLNDPTISGATADPNNNGLANLLEYAFNLNPTTGTQGSRPFAFVDPANPNYLDLVYTKFLGATDLTFTVEESTDLKSWSTASPTNVVLSDNGVLQVIKAEVPITRQRDEVISAAAACPSSKVSAQKDSGSARAWLIGNN